jgi:hypothetical protein
LPRSATLSLRRKLQAILQDWREHDGLSLCAQGLVFTIAAVALFTRRPGLFLHPQFYAEDGYVWYAQAYNTGWLHSLRLPEGGYLNTLQRLVAGVALGVPLQWAPVVMVWAGLFIQLLPVAVLLSARCRTWGSLPVRLLFAAIYIALPNAGEIHVVLTNAQWHWALAEVMLAFASAPRSWNGRAFDALLFVVGGFTGPFCIILIPLVLMYGWRRAQSWSFALAAFMGVGTLVQAVLLTHGARTPGVRGATLALFLRFFGGDVIEYTILGSQDFILRAPKIFILAAVVLGLTIHIYCLLYSNLETKLFVVYCTVLYLASLRSPMPSEKGALWPLLLGNIGARYWFFPMLAFTWCMAWCAANAGNKLMRNTAFCLLFLMPVSIVRDWKYHPYPDKHFEISVERMKAASPGEHLVIPIIPEGKKMELIKKAP